jgi:hypothetical protein
MIAKKTVLLLFLISILIGTLIITRIISQQSQDKRSKASATSPIEAFLNPPSQTLAPGATSVVQIMLKNSTTQALSFNMAGFDLQYDSNVFTVSLPANPCDQTFLPKNEIGASDAEKIYITCKVNNPTALVTIDAGDTITFAMFNLIAKTTVASGTTSQLSFARAVIPSSADAAINLIRYQEASGTSYTIEALPTLTPTPTHTPTPTATNTPTPTMTPTPTITPIPCPRGNLGDINCDGLNDETDGSLIMLNWRTYVTTPVPEYKPGQKRSADITGDGLIDEADFSKLMVNWKTQ